MSLILEKPFSLSLDVIRDIKLLAEQAVSDHIRRFHFLTKSQSLESLVDFFQWPGNENSLAEWLDVLDPTLGVWRSDMIYANGRWNVIEVNAMNAGGWIIPRLYSELYNEPIDDSLDPIPSLFRHLVSAFKKRSKNSTKLPRIVFVGDLDESDNSATARYLLDVSSKSSDCHTVGISGWDDIDFDKKCVRLEGEAIDILFELDQPSSIVRMRLAHYHKMNRIFYVAGPHARYINDKRVMALAKNQDTNDYTNVQYAPTYLDCSNNLISTMTDSLWKTTNIKLRDKDNCVLKTSDGQNGFDVYIGKYLDQNKWNRLSEEVSSGSRRWVLQSWMSPSLPSEIKVSSIAKSSHYILSPFVIGGEFCGGFIRALDVAGYTSGIPGTKNELSKLDMGHSRNADNLVPVFPI